MCDIRQQDKVEYRRLLDEIGEEYCDKDHYCIFKEFLVSSHPSRRLLVQLKCVDKMKWERSKRADKDIGWDQTFKEWLGEGFAVDFAVSYSDSKAVREIYRDTMRAHDARIALLPETAQIPAQTPLTSIPENAMVCPCKKRFELKTAEADDSKPKE